MDLHAFIPDGMVMRVSQSDLDQARYFSSEYCTPPQGVIEIRSGADDSIAERILKRRREGKRLLTMRSFSSTPSPTHFLN